MLKTHIDIIEDFDDNLVKELVQLATKHNFMIFEDRKFADIGNVVKQQYEGGMYHIAKWAHVSNSHIVSGSSSITALKSVGLNYDRGLLLIAEMSTSDALTNTNTSQAALKIAKENDDFVCGFICQQRIGSNKDSGFVYCTPGVSMEQTGDALGQHYNTPQHLITKMGVDVIIVGRGVTLVKDRSAAAKQYRQSGWSAYQERLQAMDVNFVNKSEG